MSIMRSPLLFLFLIWISIPTLPSQPSHVELLLFPPTHFPSSSRNLATFAVNEKTKVNTISSNKDYKWTMYPLSNGGFVFIWKSASSVTGYKGLFGQKFHSNGTTWGWEFRISPDSYADGSNVAYDSNPRVTALQFGGFIVLYSNDNNIYCKVYDRNGLPKGSQFKVYYVPYISTQPMTGAAALLDGGFVVSWIQNSQISVQTFNEDGTARDDVFSINKGGVNGYQNPLAETLANGSFVIVGLAGREIFGQMFRQNGDPQGVPFIIGVTNSTSTIPKMGLVPLKLGGFASIWSENMGATLNFTVNVFAPEGKNKSSGFTSNYYNDYSLNKWSAAGLRDGGFAIEYDSDGIFVYSRTYDAEGNLITVSQVQKNGMSILAEQTYGLETHVVLALNDGGFVVVWLNGDWIYGRKYDKFGNPKVKEFVLYMAEWGDYPSSIIAAIPLSNGGFAIGFHLTDLYTKVYSPTVQLECYSDSNCPTTASHCRVNDLDCVQCFQNSHCVDPAFPTCENITSYTCRACINNTDCPSNFPICSSAEEKCIKCQTTSDCVNLNPQKPICVTSVLCRGCLDNSECPSTQPICDLVAGNCQQCASSADCLDLKFPICNFVKNCPVNQPACGYRTGVCQNCTLDIECQNKSGENYYCLNGTCQVRSNTTSIPNNTDPSSNTTTSNNTSTQNNTNTSSNTTASNDTSTQNNTSASNNTSISNNTDASSNTTASNDTSTQNNTNASNNTASNNTSTQNNTNTSSNTTAPNNSSIPNNTTLSPNTTIPNNTTDTNNTIQSEKRTDLAITITSQPPYKTYAFSFQRTVQYPTNSRIEITFSISFNLFSCNSISGILPLLLSCQAKATTPNTIEIIGISSDSTSTIKFSIVSISAHRLLTENTQISELFQIKVFNSFGQLIEIFNKESFSCDLSCESCSTLTPESCTCNISTQYDATEKKCLPKFLVITPVVSENSAPNSSITGVIAALVILLCLIVIVFVAYRKKWFSRMGCPKQRICSLPYKLDITFQEIQNESSNIIKANNSIFVKRGLPFQLDIDFSDLLTNSDDLDHSKLNGLQVIPDKIDSPDYVSNVPIYRWNQLKDMKVIEVPGDDSCLFHSVAYAINPLLYRASTVEEKGLHVKNLRKLAARVMVQNAERFSEAKDFGHKSLENYVEDLQAPIFWGGFPELKAFSLHYKVSFSIFMLYAAAMQFPITIHCGEPTRKKVILVLDKRNEGHYNVIAARHVETNIELTLFEEEDTRLENLVYEALNNYRKIKLQS